MRGSLTLSIALTTVLAAVGAAQEAPILGGLGLDAPRLEEAPAGSPLTGEELERRTTEIASRLRCPACQALSVADSPTDSSQAMRAEIRELLALGYSEDQVMRYFELSYGEFIRLEPKATGFNLLVWLAPIVALLAGAGLVVARIRAARAGRIERQAEAPAGDGVEIDPYLERVRREVRG